MSTQSPRTESALAKFAREHGLTQKQVQRAQLLRREMSPEALAAMASDIKLRGRRQKR